MKIVLIEDEPLARRHLREALLEYDDRCTVVAELDSVARTIRWFAEHDPPDLVIADIELADGNVFTAFDACAIGCPIVFVTAYDQFLLRAFEDNGIGYLLKPLEPDKLHDALRKYERLRRALTRDVVDELRRAVRGPSYKTRLVVKLRDGIRLLPTADIAYIRTCDEITSAFDGQGREFPLRETLKQLEGLLDPAAFHRINRRDIVHLSFIDRLIPMGVDRLQVRLRGLDVELVSSVGRTPGLRRWLQG